MKILATPKNIEELTRNIREIVEKHSTLPSETCQRYLDRECSIVDSKTESLQGIQEIETVVLETFERIFQTSKIRPSNIYAFKGILTIYDFQLQFENLHPSEIGKTSFLPKVMKRIDEVYKSLPKAVTHPSLSKAEEEFKSIQKNASYILAIHEQAQFFLSQQLIEQDFVPVMQNYTLTQMLPCFCDRQIALGRRGAQPLPRDPSMYGITSPNGAFFTEKMVSMKEIGKISDINFSLGVLLSNTLRYEPDKNLIIFNTQGLSLEIASSLLYEIKETLKSDALPSDIREILENTRDLLVRQHVVKNFNTVRETFALKLRSLDSGLKIVNSKTSLFEEQAKSELVADRLFTTLRSYMDILKKAAAAQHSTLKEDMKFCIAAQTLIAEHELSKPFLNHLFRTAHTRVLTKIDGLKIAQIQSYREVQKTIHDERPFSEILPPEIEEVAVSGPALDEADTLEDLDESQQGESSAHAAQKKKKKKKKKPAESQPQTEIDKIAPSAASASSSHAPQLAPAVASQVEALSDPAVQVDPISPVIPVKAPSDPLVEAVSAISLSSSPEAPKVVKTPISTQLPPSSNAPVKRTHTYRYHPRVQEWFDNPETALTRSEYADLKSEEAKKNAVARHAFSTIVDEYMVRFGIITDHQNPRTGLMEKNYCIPTEIRWDNGKTDRGLATYALTKEGRIYHRCFTHKTPEKMVGELVRKGFFELVDFPPLERGTDTEKKENEPKPVNHVGSYIIEPTRPYKVQIRDDRIGAVITILKVK